MTEQAIAAFQQNLRGRLIQPTDADYDAARALYNGMIDKRPRFIARCVDTPARVRPTSRCRPVCRRSAAGSRL